MQKLTTKEEEVLRMIWQLKACAPKDVQALYADPKPHINTVAPPCDNSVRRYTSIPPSPKSSSRSTNRTSPPSDDREFFPRHRFLILSCKSKSVLSFLTFVPFGRITSKSTPKQ